MDKLGNLILYIAEQCQADESFGATKLNKILFLTDFLAYGVWGKPITGATYMRIAHGPVPRELMPIQGELIDSGRAVMQIRNCFGYEQKRLIALDEPDLRQFTQDEIELVDQVIQASCGVTASAFSDWTHTLLPWLLAEDKEVIPFHTIFTLKKEPVGTDDLKWGLSTLQDLQATGAIEC